MDSKLDSVLPLVSKLASPSADAQREGARELRLLAKLDPENRVAIARAGAIPLLVGLLAADLAASAPSASAPSAPDDRLLLHPETQENAVTALLNLSIAGPGVKAEIMAQPNALDAIAGPLMRGRSSEARENAAALLTSLMMVEEHRPAIGHSHGIIEGLVELLRSSSSSSRNGTARGSEKDALQALFYMAICAENRGRLVRHAGLLDALISLLRSSSPAAGTVEDSLAVLSQLLACPESFDAIALASAAGSSPHPPLLAIIVGFLATGKTPRTQENAASAVLNFCLCAGPPAIAIAAPYATSCMPSLYAMLEAGSPRGKRKASGLLQIFLAGGEADPTSYASEQIINSGGGI
jgi:hypothetical protein